jgi:hypothetical protein
MNKELKEVMETSTFKIIGDFLYAKVAEAPALEDCFLISKDNDEITAVFKEDKLSKLNVIEKNKNTWKLIEIKVSKPFVAIGFLATISNAIVSNNINVLIVSTYSKDYVLVHSELTDKAVGSLLKLGLRQK